MFVPASYKNMALGEPQLPRAEECFVLFVNFFWVAELFRS
jgi:hypothetical protein